LPPTNDLALCWVLGFYTQFAGIVAYCFINYLLENFICSWSLALSLYLPPRELVRLCMGLFDYGLVAETETETETETRTCTSQGQKLRAQIWAIGLWQPYCSIRNAFDFSSRSDYTKPGWGLIGHRKPIVQMHWATIEYQTTGECLANITHSPCLPLRGNYAYAMCTSDITTEREKCY